MVKILILGGGFGGIRAAIDLEKKLSAKGQAEITLIDKNNFHLFYPALYKIASAYGVERDKFAVKLKKTILIPYADIFGGRNINFVQAEIASIDLKERIIKTKGEHAFSYDYLIIAIGSRSSDFGIPGVTDYACQFKGIQDALDIREKTEILFKKAEKNGNLPIKIVVVGAGFTGIELAAEIACRAKKLAKLRITILEAAPNILPSVSQKERQIITEQLTGQGIIVMENSVVEEVGFDYVRLKNGQRLQTNLTIWTTGSEPNKLFHSVQSLSLDERRGIIINNNLMVKDFENVFAVGDNIMFIDPKSQRPIPALAYIAIDQGKLVAENIMRNINGKKLKEYRPSYNVWIAPVGGRFALVHLRNDMNIKG